MSLHEIKNEGNIELAVKSSRVFLKMIEIDGEIISTQGHSTDHVSLILDQGIAFTGDFTYREWLARRI